MNSAAPALLSGRCSARLRARRSATGSAEEGKLLLAAQDGGEQVAFFA